MADNANARRQPPAIDIARLSERKLLEARLFSADSQLRNFNSIRDRLVASGGDVSAAYRGLQAQQSEIMASLKKLGQTVPSIAQHSPQPPADGLGASIADLSIVAGRYLPGLGIFGLGTSGFVQMAPATDGVNVTGQGQFPTTGQITPVAGAPPGVVYYGGELTVGPDQLPAGQQFSTSIDYYWLHNWKYLVPFPSPTSASTFTYSFDASALLSTFADTSAGTVSVFVSVGESANLLTGGNIDVNTDVGWPLIADLSQPGPLYNGHYGEFDGQKVSVQRSFKVGGGQVPGVAIVVGVIVGLSMGSDVRLIFNQYSTIGLSNGNVAGRVAYHYTPQFVLEPSNPDVIQALGGRA